MTPQTISDVLYRHREEVRKRYGVRRLWLFGSIARGEATANSDVDLLVEFDERPVGLYHLIGAQQYLEDLLGVDKVDLVLRDTVIDELKDIIYGEAVDVFPIEEVEVSDPTHAGSH